MVFKTEWTLSFQKVPIDLLTLWANRVEQFFTQDKIRIEAQYLPHWIAFTANTALWEPIWPSLEI